MIIATITALIIFFGGVRGADHVDALDQLGAITADHITDELRAKQVGAVLKDMRAEIAQYDRRQKQFGQELVLLDKNYHADPGEYRRVTREINALWRDTENRLVDLRFEMRNLMTRDEWKAAFTALEN